MQMGTAPQSAEGAEKPNSQPTNPPIPTLTPQPHSKTKSRPLRVYVCQRSKLQAEEAAIREAQERKQKAEEAAAKAQNVAQIRENLAKELPAKLEAALAGQDQVARIVVRVPSGQRFEQKFPHNAKLELLEEWASCLKFLPSSHSPEDVEVPDKFVLCMSFPNKELVETDQTMEELKLTPSCLLCMKSLDHD